MSKKTRKFNYKVFTLHKEYGTMTEVRKVQQELKDKGYNVRVVSRGSTKTGASVYKRKK
jgi:hypothetical protein